MGPGPLGAGGCRQAAGQEFMHGSLPWARRRGFPYVAAEPPYAKQTTGATVLPVFGHACRFLSLKCRDLSWRSHIFQEMAVRLSLSRPARDSHICIYKANANSVLGWNSSRTSSFSRISLSSIHAVPQYFRRGIGQAIVSSEAGNAVGRDNTSVEMLRLIPDIAADPFATGSLCLDNQWAIWCPRPQ